MKNKKTSRKSAVTQPKKEIIITGNRVEFHGEFGKRVKRFCKETGMTVEQLMENAVAAQEAKLKPAATKHELLQWLESMPESFQDPDGEVQVPMVLDLDVTAWGVYARAAKTRGISIERMKPTKLRHREVRAGTVYRKYYGWLRLFPHFTR